MSLPDDLMPLPTAPYDERPVSMPLDIEECRTALWLERGNITEAARRIKVSSHRLRRFVEKSPRLMEEQREAQQQLVDKAEDVVYDALSDEDPSRRDTMARFVLTNLGKERGYGTGSGNITIKPGSGKGAVMVTWGDNSPIQGEESSATDEDVKVIEHDAA
jgi:hypothetical protein